MRYALGTEGSPFSSDIRVNAPATRTTIRSLRTDNSYVVQVQAVNAIGKGTSSEETEFSTSSCGFSTCLSRSSFNPDELLIFTLVCSLSLMAILMNTLYVRWSQVTQANGGGEITGYTIEYRVVDADGVWDRREC